MVDAICVAGIILLVLANLWLARHMKHYNQEAVTREATMMIWLHALKTWDGKGAPLDHLRNNQN